MMNKERLKDIFVFIVGLMGYFKFRMMGTFYGNEILIFASSFFIGWSKFLNNKNVLKLMGLAFLWLIGTVISDVWNSTGLENALKGSFNVVFIILLMPFVYWMMYDKLSRWLYYAAGAALALAVSFYTGRGIEVALDSIEDLDIWQVYFFQPAIIVIAGLIYYRGRHWLSYIIIEAFALWSLSYASRNVFLTSTISVCVLLYIDIISKSGTKQTVKTFRNRIWGLMIAFIIGLAIADIVYENLASSGRLGERVYDKYMLQKYSKHGLASGRDENLTTMEFISQSPIFGYGSFATYSSPKAIETYNKLGIEVYDPNEILPGHSYILGAWIYSGIFGCVYWLFVLIYMFHILKSGILLVDKKMLGFRMFTFFSCLWNILFSPLQNRIDILLLVINLMLFESYFNKKYRES